MKRHLPNIRGLLLSAPFFLTPLVHAQWIGAGAGGVGTDFNDTANWTDGVINGDFTGNVADGSADLSGDVALTSLDFRWGDALDFSLGGTANIDLAGGVYLPTSASTITVGAGVTLDLGEITTTRTIGSTTGSGDLVMDGVITGTASGAGKINFGGNSGSTITLTNDNNSFDSPIVIAEGVLRFTSVGSVNGGNSALGRATSVENGVIALSRNSTLDYIGNGDQTTDRIVQSQAINTGNVTLRHSGSGGTLTYQSDFDLGTGTGQLLLFVSQSASTMRFDGVISAGNSASVKINDGDSINGRVVFANEASSYSGYTEISRGVLEVTKLANGGELSSIGRSSNAANSIRFGAWGNNTPVLRYIGAGDSTDRLFLLRRSAKLDSSGAGALKFTNTGSLTYGSGNYERLLVLGGENTGDNTFAIGLADPGVGSNRTRLNKVDSGKWILTGASTYTGDTTVSAGTLLVDGTLASAIVVNAGVFGGAGSTTGAVTIGNGSGSRDAVFEAGAGVGGFATTSGLEFKSDAEFVFTFDSTGGVAAFAGANGVAIHSSAYFTFVDIGDGSGVNLNDSFVILSNTGGSSIVGTFANLGENGEFTANGITWRASYLGGDGNDLIITAIALGAIPEPSSVTLVVGAAGLLTAGVARRRRSS